MASRSSQGYVDNSRRTFRGRAGPTDGRLNKHQARRRKVPHDGSTKVGSKYENEGEKQVEVVEEVKEDEDVSANEVTQQEVIEEEECSAGSPADKEIQHLLRRVGNVRESIQLSATANANPSTWQQNVLNPVQNCVGEWRAIVSHYENELETSDCKQPALEVFQLIQMTMQSGPLAGGKPGYFKRCGSEVARQALQFLDVTVPNQEEATFLHFSEKQSDAIEKWRSNAKKAVENDKPPSKSTMKKQTKAKKKK